MRASPLQVKTIGILSISIEPRRLVEGEKRAPKFDWDGVTIETQTHHEQRSKDEGANLYIVGLDLDIPNKEIEGATLAPYKISISGWGLFEWNGETEAAEDVLDQVVVNGTSMIYGTFREMISMVSSRMINGMLQLPTATFFDHKPSLDVNAPKTKRKTPSPPPIK